jgi:protein-disulfide isomerase
MESFMLARLGRLSRNAVLAATAACVIASPAHAFTDAEKDEIGTIVREYLLKHPEVLEEVVSVLEARNQAAQAEQASKAVKELKSVLVDGQRGVVVANPKGDVTLVEFFDYNCGYCKRALADLQDLVKADPNLRVVLREFPVLGQGSVEAAQVAVAVRMVAPEKYMAFHQALMGMRGQADRAKAFAAAKQAGIDVAALEKQATSPELNATLDESMKLAQALGQSGTPFYVIGEQVVMGAQGVDVLKAAVAQARQQAKAGK